MRVLDDPIRPSERVGGGTAATAGSSDHRPGAAHAVGRVGLRREPKRPWRGDPSSSDAATSETGFSGVVP